MYNKSEQKAPLLQKGANGCILHISKCSTPAQGREEYKFIG